MKKKYNKPRLLYEVPMLDYCLKENIISNCLNCEKLYFTKKSSADDYYNLCSKECEEEWAEEERIAEEIRRNPYYWNYEYDIWDRYFM